jgi:hypothetical protein
MVDIGELLELAEELDVPFFFIQKIALGVWDAEKAWKILQSYKKGWEELEKTIEIGSYSLRVKVHILPEEKSEAEKHLNQVLRSLEEEMAHPERLEEVVSQEITAMEHFIEEHHLARLGVEEDEDEGGSRRKKRRKKEQAEEG